MRKSRVKEIRTACLADPMGMSAASFRKAKRDHANGLRRLTSPVQRASKRRIRTQKVKAGFPKNTYTFLGVSKINGCAVFPD